jgi:Protein of unknown function (DUF3800)
MDEAGNTGRKLDDPQQPIHEIVALLIAEECVSGLHADLRSIARQWFHRDYFRHDFEFHGADIFHGKGWFDSLAPAERVVLYDELLQAVGRNRGRVVVRGVVKPNLAARYPNPYHPHDIALMFTLEEIERFARAEASRTQQECRFLVVADENKESEDSALRDLASYQQFGTSWGWNPISIDHIVDTIHFVRSETNWAIQLADCLAFLENRRTKIAYDVVPMNESAAAVNDMYDRLVRPHVVVLNIWAP